MSWNWCEGRGVQEDPGPAGWRDVPAERARTDRARDPRVRRPGREAVAVEGLPSSPWTTGTNSAPPARLSVLRLLLASRRRRYGARDAPGRPAVRVLAGGSPGRQGECMTTADTLEQGRESFERRAWADAFVKLSAAGCVAWYLLAMDGCRPVRASGRSVMVLGQPSRCQLGQHLPVEQGFRDDRDPAGGHGP
jgi:hypothetical protein